MYLKKKPYDLSEIDIKGYTKSEIQDLIKTPELFNNFVYETFYDDKKLRAELVDWADRYTFYQKDKPSDQDEWREQQDRKDWEYYGTDYYSDSMALIRLFEKLSTYNINIKGDVSKLDIEIKFAQGETEIMINRIYKHRSKEMIYALRESLIQYLSYVYIDNHKLEVIPR